MERVFLTFGMRKPRRQADAMNHNQFRTGTGGPRILIRAVTLCSGFNQPGIGGNCKLRLHGLAETSNIMLAGCQEPL